MTLNRRKFVSWMNLGVVVTSVIGCHQNTNQSSKTFANNETKHITNDELKIDGLNYTGDFRGATAVNLQNELDRRLITPQMFGAIGDGLNNDYSAFNTFISECLTQGVTGYVPHGSYLISSTIRRTALTNDLHLVLSPQATLLADTGSSPLFMLACDTDKFARIIMEGGTIDTSRTTFLDGENSGTAIALRGIWRSHFHKIVFTTGATTYNSSSGDSGISAVRCFNLSVDSCWFGGMPDAGIYWSGGVDETTSEDNGGDCTVVNSYFEYCQVGCTLKREVSRVSISNNFFFRCQFGIKSNETGNNPIPGTQALITGNSLNKIGKVGIELRWGEYHQIYHNKIIDFGYNLANHFSSEAVGIRLGGSSWISGSGNIIAMKEWSGTQNHVGILIQKYTNLNNITRESNNVIFSNTIFRGSSSGNIGIGIGIYNSSSNCNFIESKFKEVSQNHKITSTSNNNYTYYTSDNSLVYGLDGTEHYRIRADQRDTTRGIKDPHITSDKTGYVHLANGQHRISINSAPGIHVNRIGTDGNLITLLENGSIVGDISVSSGTVSYNGGHLTKNAKSDGTVNGNTLVGTVVSNRDNLINFGVNSQVKHLNYIGVSDIAGDRCWAGVFQGWKQNEDGDFLDIFDVARKGDFMIRVASDVIVKSGDLLDSAGDGTAKLQLKQNKIGPETIGKVVSSQTVESLKDNSRLIAIEIF